MKKTASKSRSKKRVVRRSSTFSTKPRGVSKVILLAIVAIVLAVGGGLYVLSQNGALPVGNSIIKAPLNPNCKYNDPELCKFFNNYVNMPKAYSVTSTGKYGGVATESVYEVDGEDKFHMLAKQNGKETSNMITIGDTTYTLDYTDNKWWKVTSKPVEAMEEEMEDDMSFNPEEVEDNTTYKFIAKEACGDRTCFKYEVITPDSGGTKMYIWFDDRDYLMRKMSMVDKSGMSSESVYSYENISITAPSPVKEGNPYSAGGSNSGYSDAETQKMIKQYQQDLSGNESAAPDYEVPLDDTSTEGF